MTSFVDFHTRSAFSFLEAASLPEDLVQRAADLGHSAMALMDRDNLCGAPRFYMAAKKLGAKAHIGAEISGEDGDLYPLLVENRTGYQNLCRLITSMKLRSPKGEAAASQEELYRFSSGLVCLTGEGSPTRQHFDKLVSLFGRGNVYAELQRHFHRDQEARNQAVIELARSMQLPLLATNGVRQATLQERELADVLTAVRHKTTVMAAGQLLARNSERYLKSPRVMEKLFSDVPEAIAETAELSARLDFTLANLGYEFPKYPVGPGETMNSFLRERTDEGARQRYRPYHEKARRQIERELALIEKLDLAGYFLIVWDLVEFCRREKILVQGRGSAANSAVCYSLGITAVDPVAMELLFERFLSEERGEMPDIDLDLPSGDQRERVIQYVYQRYGARGAAMTANVITYRGKSAARDVGKALGFPAEALEKLSSLVATWGWRDPDDTAQRQFQQAGFDLKDPRIQKYLSLYVAAQNLPRHLGQHSGGMVVCQGQLDSVVPLEPATMPGRVVIEWDKDDCADLGLIKIDLLGLGMMAVLEESIELIREHYPEPVDLAHLPPDDPKVYAALQKADTIGMFQVESRAQMSCLPRLKPKKFYDIVVQVAIIRPGPIVGKMLHPYLNRRQGYEEAACLHPSLEQVLKRTLGVPLFQEQLLRIAMIAANFTGGEAEQLRRAMGFKRSEARMREIEIKLRSGMTTNGILGETQDRIVQSITSFSLYGFPESHAASFALIAYASAYLKCHYLAAFTAAMLNNQPMGFYHPATLVKDAQRHGLHFRPVDVQQSQWKCTLEPRGQGPGASVRLGLNYVRGFRQETAEAIVAERPFSSIVDLADRVHGIRKPELRMLAEVGALNSLIFPAHNAARRERSSESESAPCAVRSGGHRRDALWEAERALRPAGPLFEMLEETGPRPLAPGPSPLAPMTTPERIRADFFGTGVTIGPHPMRLYRHHLRTRGVIAAEDLQHIPHGRLVRVAGCVICRQRPGTAKGFMFLSLEDETGIANGIVEPDLFDAYRETLVTAPYLLVEGILQNQQGAVSVKLNRAEAIDFKVAEVPSHDFR
ncbi:MAG TPA: error-prone DNA polymerase [Bryobacteraceae bacterium]|nr:error-prone DNA polymerase [Bryobacteraceae bacterium]